MTNKTPLSIARGAALIPLIPLMALMAPGAAWGAPVVLASSPDPLAPPQVFMLVGAGRAYMADYQAADWTGRLRAWQLGKDGTQLAQMPEWDSAEKLDAAAFSVDDRTVLSHDGSAGIAFRWANLSQAQRAALSGVDGDAVGRRRLDFVRGDHSAEFSQGGSLRDRRRVPGGQLFRQADIVHSRPWLTGRPVNRALPATLGDRPDMVYAGGNDGMLHGFDALTGQERLAYVPAGLFAQLRAWTLAPATHRYLVDGHAFSGEADIHRQGSASAWATVLVGTAGAGAPGFFVLDVSQPAVFAETAADRLVLVDASDGTDADIGHITADPSTDAAGSRSNQIVQLNDGRWAVLMGNGINSRNEMPVLLVQYLDQARELKRIVPPCPPAGACTHRGNNGLATPITIDRNGDGKVDVAYAGDLLGNVWKFDISSGKPADWKTALNGNPLFTARDASGNPQPITSPLTWLPHPLGGVMLGLGTGRDLTVADRSDRQVQALYGLYDQGRVIDPATLVAQTLLSGVRTVDGHAYVRSSTNPVNYKTQPSPGGWYMNLPTAGEKVLHAPRPFAGQKVAFYSGAAGQDYLSVLNLFSGQPSARPVFAALVDPLAATPPVENISRVGLSRGAVALVNQPRRWLLATPGQPTLVLDKGNGDGIRAGWRQLK